MLQIHKLSLILATITYLIVLPLQAMDQKAQHTENDVKLLGDHKFILHNMYGCVFLDQLRDEGKEMRVQFTFSHINGKSLHWVKSNFITLKAGERKTIDLSTIQLWYINLWDEQSSPTPVTFKDIALDDLNILLNWPLGYTFSQSLKQPYGTSDYKRYPWIVEEKKKSKDEYHFPETVRGYETGGIKLPKGRHLRIIKGDVIINGDDANPCAAVIQKDDQNNFIGRF